MSRKNVLNQMADCTSQLSHKDYWRGVLSKGEWEEQSRYIEEVVDELMGVLVKRMREESK